MLKSGGHTFVGGAGAGVEAEAGAGGGAGVGGPGLWAAATAVLGQKSIFNVLNMAAMATAGTQSHPDLSLDSPYPPVADVWTPTCFN